MFTFPNTPKVSPVMRRLHSPLKGNTNPFAEHPAAVDIVVVADSAILVNDHHQAQLGSPTAGWFATARLIVACRLRLFASARGTSREFSCFTACDWL